MLKNLSEVKSLYWVDAGCGKNFATQIKRLSGATIGSNRNEVNYIRCTIPRGSKGYDASHTGRKRHIIVDTVGLVIAAEVHSASIQDRDSALNLFLPKLNAKFPTLRKFFADQGYIVSGHWDDKKKRYWYDKKRSTGMTPSWMETSVSYWDDRRRRRWNGIRSAEWFKKQ
ncbi:hypothetical protein TNIN_38611 [Trichonephila inaurata madagascariensis]|uniref:Transposase IS4-like domain-containing protein n=1 Tax=Trichonephila inaurata madagascariensis TaxID=2747483 RepID=A0A8X7CBJ5_9ARAC|nr:hypothetical protein TNIN_38611 [Trichonephila inaurata madagascariensis]